MSLGNIEESFIFQETMTLKMLRRSAVKKISDFFKSLLKLITFSYGWITSGHRLSGPRGQGGFGPEPLFGVTVNISVNQTTMKK